MRTNFACTLKIKSFFRSYTGYIDSVHLAHLYIKSCIAQPENTQRAGNGLEKEIICKNMFYFV